MAASPLSLCSRLVPLAFALLAVPVTAQTYTDDDQTLVLFDAMCCQAGDTPIDQHAPEIGEAWTVEGTADDALKPTVTSSRLAFQPGSPAIAVGRGPTGERTLRAVVWEPQGHTADVTLYLMERYRDPHNYAALRLRWTATGRTVAVDAVAVASGAAAAPVALGTLPASGYARRVPVVITSAPSSTGHTWTVHVDGAALPTASVPGLVGAPAFGLAADAPAHPHPDGHHAAVEDVMVLVPSAPATVVCDGLRGWTAESCIRGAFTPLRTYNYDEARDHLFETVWASGAGGDERDVGGLYGGLVRTWTPRSPLSPREQMQAQDFNTEHVWPRSRGAQTHPSTDGAAHNDLHHLAPAYGPFNSARSNRAFGDDFPASDTQKWLRNATSRYNSSGPPSDPETWSRVEYDFLRQSDNGDGWKELDELGRFDVRHALRGDVARMAAYFLTTYRIEAEMGDEGRAFIDATLDVLLDWHEADPVDDAERERNERVYRIQGNRNPFVLDPTLMRRTFYQGANQPRPRDLWINEVHHSNSGADQNEGVEIAGRAGTDLYGYRVWVYSGYGYVYQVDGDGTDNSPAIAFRGTIDDEGGGLGAVWQGAEGLRGGCQGLALTDPDGALLQFLSYGGCRFNATSGPVHEAAERHASGAGSPAHPDSLAWSTAIRGPRQAGGTHRRVQQWSELPPGHTLQLTGAGSAYADFAWTGPLPHSRGRLNSWQAPASAANPASGWASGDAVPLGLLAPAVDTGHDEDAPHTPLAAPLAPEAGELTVSRPAPNPARSAARLTVSAPPGTRVVAAVYDALGRTVLRQRPVGAVLGLDVSRLAPGVYTVRVTAEGATQAVTRLLTVAR
ncbi:endonuclease [Rubricoccus marinus]|uniref:Secretion system C-terminal sorting domain-containing protein n=1 Tax=Rubricoccus marinus TaxID=716817 RepID=A0A259TUL9_9BACT|nr:endonuclease [Rubricoccus marinus]OZC01386.1 hypothetical protein BSZ36_17000 [Rubricoccus marinus]